MDVVKLSGTFDAFKRNNAPKFHYVDERGEDRYRYESEAYTPDYMVKSDDTGRYLRWVYSLSNGKFVSLESYLKAVHPELVGRVSSGKNALEKIYSKLPRDERDALIESIPWFEVLPPEYNNYSLHRKAFNYIERWLIENKHPLANVVNAQSDLGWRIEKQIKINMGDKSNA